MLSTEFAKGYADELTAERIHRGSHAEYITDAQNWSYKFGRLLHAALTDKPIDALSEQLVDAYPHWLDTQLLHVPERVSLDKPETYANVVSETNFHRLNNHMLGMWAPIGAGKWEVSDKDRRTFFANMRIGLAMEGVWLLALREAVAKHFGSPTLFTEHNTTIFNAINGSAQEFDAALVMLDVIQKHRHLALVPAPLQFERGDNPKNNVDFVVADFIGKRAVGVQVKSSVTARTAANYDSSRVVLIDGNVDFDNVKAVRTKTKSSDRKVVTWPGMVAAKRMQDVPLHGHRLNGSERERILRFKLLSRKLLEGTKVDYQLAGTRIGARILEKL